VLWALILGFALSRAIQALVSKREMRGLMPDDSRDRLGPRCRVVVLLLCLGRARMLAVPQGREPHRGDGVRVASTNLVIELGITMGLLGDVGLTMLVASWDAKASAAFA
jgi:hypothetical protein